jgi:hypothetical protein
MGSIVHDLEDDIRGAVDTIFPGVGQIPDEYIGPAAALAGSAFGPFGAIIGAVLGGWLADQWSDEPDQQQFEAMARGILLNTESNDAPLPVVYGRRRIGGITILKEVSSAGIDLHKVIALCEGEIHQIQNVFFDQDIEGTSRFSGWLYVERYLGTDTQAASTVLPTFVTAWTSAHQGKGIAYIWAKMSWSNDVWRAEPVITADILGRKVYDPRVAGSPTVYAFSNNAALAIRDYLTNQRFGRGIPDASIDDTTFIAAANHCDERITVPTASQTFTADASTDQLTLNANTYIGLGDGVQVSSSGVLPGGLSAAVTYYFIPTGDATGKLATSVANALAGTAIDISDAGSGTHTASHIDQARYTCDGFIDTSRQPIDNVRALLTACRGYLYFSGGKWKLGIDQATAASGFVFDEDNIVGAWQIRPPGKRTRFNRAQGRFFNPAKQWQPDFVIYDNPTYRTEDNGLVLEATEVELPFTANPYRASRIIQQEVRQSRVGIEATFRATIEALRCEVGDVVEITHTTPGWALKKFRVVGLKLMSSDEVEVRVREYDVGVYSLDALSAVRTAPATNLPNPFANLDITGLTASSGTADLFRQGDGTIVPRVRLRWTALSNSFVTTYEVQFSRLDASPTDWVDAPSVVGPATEGFAAPVEDGVAYDLRVRARTSLGNAGAWSYVRSHTVIGKTELPSDVTSFSAVQSGGVIVFSCPSVEDADLDAVEIRRADPGNSNWDDAEPLVNILRGQTATNKSVPPGEWRFLAKARDTSGNYSANVVFVDLEVTADGFTTISSVAQAPAWLGTLTHMVRHWTGVLTPESQSLASALGWEVFDEFVPNAYADCYYTAPEVDKSIDAPARIYGDIVSVLGPGETSGVAAPELQIDYRASSASYDGFENWSVGVVEFRYMTARIHVDTTVGKPVISAFQPTIDAESREENGTLTVGGGGSGTVTFTTAFHTTPALQLTPQGSGDVTASYVSLTTTGFTGHFKTAGVASAGTMSYTATGV